MEDSAQRSPTRKGRPGWKSRPSNPKRSAGLLGPSSAREVAAGHASIPSKYHLYSGLFRSAEAARPASRLTRLSNGPNEANPAKMTVPPGARPDLLTQTKPSDLFEGPEVARTKPIPDASGSEFARTKPSGDRKVIPFYAIHFFDPFPQINAIAQLMATLMERVGLKTLTRQPRRDARPLPFLVFFMLAIPSLAN